MKKSEKRIGSIIYKWLIILVLGAFALAAAAGLLLQNYFQERQSFTLLREYIDNFEANWDFNAYMKEDIYSYRVTFNDPESGSFDLFQDNDYLKRYVEANAGYLTELSLVNDQGIITYSSNPDKVGYDLHDSDYMSGFLCILDGEEYYAGDFDPNPFDTDEDLKMVYSAVSVPDYDGLVLFGFDQQALELLMDDDLWDSTTENRIGNTGFLIACNKDKIMAGITSAATNENLKEDTPYAGEVELPETENEITEIITDFYGEKCYVSAVKQPDYYLIAAYPVKEANALRDKFNVLFVIALIIVLAALFAVLYFLLKKHVVDEVSSIHGSLEKITEGDLDEKADADGSLEFYGLSGGINDTVSNLKDRLQAAKEQMAEEMENARQIQESAVPGVFPEQEKFGLYASMDTAEAVGGDFYDFFMTDPDTLVFVIADVCGKGMPAALYMMRAKTLIKTCAEQHLPVDEVALTVNRKLCEDSSRKMFVTAWLGFLDLRTGLLSYVHAGHSFPIHVGKEVSFVKQKSNMILGGIKSAKYIRQEITLLPGESLYLYTDGVTEAQNKSEELYGEERLLELIKGKQQELSSLRGNALCKAGCDMVYRSVMEFTGDAPQFDDITMMWVTYNAAADDNPAPGYTLPEDKERPNTGTAAWAMRRNPDRNMSEKLTDSVHGASRARETRAFHVEAAPLQSPTLAVPGADSARGSQNPRQVSQEQDLKGAGPGLKKFYRKRKLETIILIWLAVIMVIAVAASSAAGFLLQNYFQERQAFSVIGDYLETYIEKIDVDGYINQYFDQWMNEIIDIEGDSRKTQYYDNDVLARVSSFNRYYLNEVSIVDRNGIITYSSNPEMIGTDIRGNDRLAPFACLLEGETSYSDSFVSSPFHDSVKEAYAGRAFRDKSGFVLWGIDKDNYQQFCNDKIIVTTEDARIGMTGYLINCDPDKNITSATHSMAEAIGETFTGDFVLPEEEGKIKESICNFYGKECYVGAIRTPDYYVIGAYPVAEADQFKLQNNILFFALLFLVLLVFFIALFIMLKKIVIKGVEKTHASLNRITGGDLDEKVDVRGSLEFTELSSGINETVDKLKDLIREEDERVKNELLMARYIQESSVPGKFPPYPDNEAFGLFASMHTVEDVGGDFYDFFMVDENTLAIVMADVCGKGLPAALYMMRAKTLIKSCADQGLPVEEVAKQVNSKLCEDTSRDMLMFVTAWLGFLDLKTGLLSFVHAGHTFPVRISNEVSFVKQETNSMLGADQTAKYVRQEILLLPGDSIFLYTDGITEAKDPDGNLYGDDRLLDFISNMAGSIDAADRNDYCREACERILSEIKHFEAGAGQYDDITMMWVKYCCNSPASS